MTTGELSGRAALVTGAGSGIGRATAVLLARHGASVAVADIAAGGADETAALIGSERGKALAVKADVTDEQAVGEAFARVAASLGAVDILVNCAGGGVGGSGPVVDMDLAGWRATFRLNLDGTLTCCRAALPGMIERRWGRIVNIGSSSGFRLQAGGGAYAVSKAAIPAFTKLLAREVGEHRITVNCVVPSLTVTPFTQRVFPSDEAMRSQVAPGGLLANPLGVLLEPEDQAEAVLYLCRESGRFVTGQTLHVNGGHWMP